MQADLEKPSPGLKPRAKTCPFRRLKPPAPSAENGMDGADLSVNLVKLEVHLDSDHDRNWLAVSHGWFESIPAYRIHSILVQAGV